MQTFDNASSGAIVLSMAERIVENRAYLSEIDGKIGDGDHGVNMAKGFAMAAERLKGKDASLSESLDTLGTVLMTEIGGSMGPLYGNFFLGFVNMLEAYPEMDAKLFGEALAAAVSNVQGMGNAKVGDKTLIDTMVPALNAYTEAVGAGSSFADALKAMSVAAEAGKNSTKDLQARIGRSARLGPRSIGVLDAGATSCCLILQSISASLQRHLAK